MKRQGAAVRAAFSLVAALAGCDRGTASAPGEASPDAAPTSIVAAPRPAWSDEASPVPVSSRDPVWGSRDAPVTIVAFLDLECPYSARSRTTLRELMETYGPSKLRIVYKELPLPTHAGARRAAAIAQAVFVRKGLDRYRTFNDNAFSPRGHGERGYELWAEKAGLDAATLQAELQTGAPARKVDADLALAARLGIDATPTLRINGVAVNGTPPRKELEKVVDEELDKAMQAINDGTPPTTVYVKMSTANVRR